MLPVVAIVGRPNVGKSTLFNCLTSSRAALVSHLPGMTRDRQYGEAEINNHHFIVIDTGGLTDDQNDLNQLAKEQSLQAVQEADSVLFVVDGRENITSMDLHVAETLRSLKKPIFLVINKTEKLDPDCVMADFFQLGFGTPIPISAAHKEGMDELVQTIFKDMKSSLHTDEQEKRDGIHLAIIGRPNVGKSTLTNRFLGEERVIVFDQPGTTRDSIFIPLDRKNKHYTIIDTAGIRKRGKIFEATEKFSVVKTLQAIQVSHVVLFLMDAEEGITDQDLRLLGFILESGRGLVLAINKWDNLTPSGQQAIKKEIDRRLNFLPFARLHFISALHGTGINKLFSSIDEAYASANKKLTTSELTTLLREAVESHEPPLVRGRRIKLRYAHAGGHHPPVIVVHGNQVTELPDSYIKYLANTFQKRLKLMGTPVRIELKSGDNPFKDKKNPLTSRQQRKKTRLIRRAKKIKKGRR